MKWLFLVTACSLAACTNPGVQPPRALTRADSADQVLEGMTHNVMRRGILVSVVDADSAWIYQLSGLADLKGVHVRFFDSTGKLVSTVAAKTGVFQMVSQSLDAKGAVVVTRPDGSILNTEHLVYDPAGNQIRSDTAFKSTTPKGVMTGKSFVTDPTFKNLHVDQPAGRAKGKGFLLPGQKPDSGK